MIEPGKHAFNYSAVALHRDTRLDQQVFVIRRRRVCMAAKGGGNRNPAPDRFRCCPIQIRIRRDAVQEFGLPTIVERMALGVQRVEDVALVLEALQAVFDSRMHRSVIGIVDAMIARQRL